MVETIDEVALRELPMAPSNPMPYRQQVSAIRTFHTGLEALRDAGGPVTRLRLAPTWLMPPVVVATSPQGARDILGRVAGHTDKTLIHDEMRRLLGPNLLDLTHEPWLPRRRALQPIFTKQHVGEFGGHMAQAAQTVTNSWSDGAHVDLDSECRRLTLRALGRSVLGLDLDAHSDAIAKPLRVALEYVADRAAQPLRAPRWLPTPARRRARAASDELHGLADEILQACRTDPTRDAPLVRALIARRRSRDRAARCPTRTSATTCRVHARRARHDRHGPHLRPVGARPSPRRRRSRSPLRLSPNRRSRADARRRASPATRGSGAARVAAAVPASCGLRSDRVAGHRC